MCNFARSREETAMRGTKATSAGQGKRERLAALKDIISATRMSCQEELLCALRELGFSPTQATLSRDLKQLRVAKIAGAGGKHFYALPAETTYKRVAAPQPTAVSVASEGFLSLNFSGNIAVIRTRPGYAGSIAYNIDGANINDILGTVAGDDTIVIVVKEGVSDAQLIRSLQPLIPAVGQEREKSNDE